MDATSGAITFQSWPLPCDERVVPAAGAPESWWRRTPPPRREICQVTPRTTSVPFFPSAASTVLGLAGVGALVALRRRL